MKHELSNVNHIRDCIFHNARMLGARSPSEDTKRIFACMMLMLSTPNAQVKIRKELKQSTYENVRERWPKFIRRAEPPPFYIMELEAMPSRFMDKHPDMYREAYGDGPGPVPSRLCHMALESMADSIKCRGASQNDSDASAAGSQQVPTLHLPGGGLEAFAQHLLSHMEKTAERQERMMEMLMDGDCAPRTKRSRTGERELEDMFNHRAGTRSLALEAPPASRESSQPPAGAEESQTGSSQSAAAESQTNGLGSEDSQRVSGSPAGTDSESQMKGSGQPFAFSILQISSLGAGLIQA